MRSAVDVRGEDASGTTVVVGQLFRVRSGREKRFVGKQPEEPASRPAKLARQLALAHWIQKAIEAGEVRNQADVARTLELTRARVTQLLDLTLLAPDIQERLVGVEATGLSERALRSVSGIEDWNGQRRALTEHPLAPGRARRISRDRR